MEFPMKLFPQDFDANLTGFGGDRLKNKAEHRAGRPCRAAPRPELATAWNPIGRREV